MKEIKVFKQPSKLRFELNTNGRVPLSSAERGDVFLREGAVCMRVEMESLLERETTRAGKAYIINLQTGRVWTADGADSISFVQAVVTLEGE